MADRSTPGKDLASAVVIGAFALTVMVMSLRLDVPGDLYTAPGMLPFLISATLLIMAVALGAKAVSRGGAADAIAGSARAARRYVTDDEGRRTIMLVGIVILYVLLVAFITFELRIPAFLFDLELTSYEVISVVMISWILRIFWRASVMRCFVVSLITIEALASIFRYGFGIIMPEAF